MTSRRTTTRAQAIGDDCPKYCSPAYIERRLLKAHHRRLTDPYNRTRWRTVPGNCLAASEIGRGRF